MSLNVRGWDTSIPISREIKQNPLATDIHMEIKIARYTKWNLG